MLNDLPLKMIIFTKIEHRPISQCVCVCAINVWATPTNGPRRIMRIHCSEILPARAGVKRPLSCASSTHKCNDRHRSAKKRAVRSLKPAQIPVLIYNFSDGRNATDLQ